MRVLHLSSYDTLGGAALAALRLHNGLREVGVDSRMLVRRRYTRHSHVFQHGNLWTQVCARLRRRHERWYVRASGATKAARFSTGLRGSPLGDAIQSDKPQILHLHWVNDGYFDVSHLSSVDCAVVWTMHDMWPFTGGCHYSGECRSYFDRCGRCPQLDGRTEVDLSRRVWATKQRAYAAVNLTGVCPSQWLLDRARMSSLWRDRALHCIPNGIDVDRFTPRDHASVPAGSAATRKRLVLAGSTRFRLDARKGFDLFQRLALRLHGFAPNQFEFVTFGTKPAGVFSHEGVQIRELGEISPEQLAAVYSGADVFVAPSREDNLPNTIIEALACGTPAAAFAIGGIPEIIAHGRDGVLAEPFSVEQLADGIRQLLADAARLTEARIAARKKAETEFSIPVMTRRYVALYERILARQ